MVRSFENIIVLATIALSAVWAYDLNQNIAIEGTSRSTVTRPSHEQLIRQRHLHEKSEKSEKREKQTKHPSVSLHDDDDDISPSPTSSLYPTYLPTSSAMPTSTAYPTIQEGKGKKSGKGGKGDKNSSADKNGKGGKGDKDSSDDNGGKGGKGGKGNESSKGSKGGKGGKGGKGQMSSKKRASQAPSLSPTVTLDESEAPTALSSSTVGPTFTDTPSESQTISPSEFASESPTAQLNNPESPSPSAGSSAAPSNDTQNPSAAPSDDTQNPSAAPSADTQNPSATPSSIDSQSPSAAPSVSAAPSTSVNPSAAPSVSSSPSATPTTVPSGNPSGSPSGNPSSEPTIEGIPENLRVADFETTLDLQNVDDKYQDVFVTAADRWAAVIVGDMPGLSVTDDTRDGTTCENLPDSIDDVFICASVSDIDGVSGVVGSSGPEYGARVGDFIVPLIGSMRFDSADIDDLVDASLLESVVMHEMGRMYGIGSLWNMNRLVQESSSSTCSYAPSSRATAEYQKLSGCDTRIPLGEDCGHWDNFCFENEIMTGFTGGNLLLSRMTIASLEDMGYVVNYDAADDYGVEDMDASCVCKRDVSSDLPVGGSQAANHKKAHEETTVRKLGTGASKLEFKQAQLSLSGRLEAESYGRQLLQEAKLRKKLIIQREGFVYLGDQVISVLYMEKGQIYGVEVRGD